MRSFVVKIVFLYFLAWSFNVSAQSVVIKVTHIRNTKGVLQLKFYKNATSFDNDTPFMIKRVPKDKVVNGELSVKFHLDSGTYGIALIDDENNNGKMDYNFFGLPAEGFGFSNFYLTGMHKPKFSDFDFVLKKETKEVHIKIRYM